MPYTSSSSHGPSASPGRPFAGTAPYDRIYNNELVAVKAHLMSMLRTNRLSNMPMCFPFHTVYDPHNRSSFISHASYEFQEQFCLSDQQSRIKTVTISYMAPPSDFQQRQQQQSMMKWWITVPSREPSLNGNMSTLAIAQVEVDPMVIETSYGIRFMTDPRVLLTALSLSIEFGILITVAVGNMHMIHPTDRNLNYEPGDTIFIATDNNRRSEVVSVFRA